MKWWKILAVVILLYVHIAGLLIPIGIGITNVSPFQVKGGEKLDLQITTYNADLEPAGVAGLRSWLKLDDDHLIESSAIVVKEENRLNIEFDLPAALPGEQTSSDLTLILDIPGQGTPVLPRAVFMSIDPETVSSGSQWADIDLSHLNVSSVMHFPYRAILQETIRNTYFHVSLWLAMMIILTGAVIYSVLYLKNKNLSTDSLASSLTEVGFLFGILGLTTGMIWAKYTWGKAWSWDIKQLTTAIALLIYAAYFLLRNTISDPHRKAQLSAVFNIFAYIVLIPLLYIIPRMSDSLHPGSGGNPAMGGEDLDSTMRMVFYPAVIGWALAGIWISEILSRMKNVKIILKNG